ncbi:MAG: glycosyltransferase family 2 protein [Nitrospira sp.]|nr:MAG: glycosyltransferase family 2 protein [Nitrospira sp.]
MGLLSNQIPTSKKSSIIQELQQAIVARNQSVNDVASELMRSWEKGGTKQSERAFTEATPPLISVVVPLFNEQDNVAHLVERLANTLNILGKSYEVLLIDDGSRDATWTRIVKAAAQHHPHFRGLRLARNFGHQAALLAGLSHARGQAVVSMDGDLQHPPELIPELIKAWKRGVAVVETRRHYNAQTSCFKKLSSALFYRFFSLMSEIDMKEGRSDFRLVDRRVLDQVLAFQQSDIFLRGVVSWLDFPSTTIEFEAANRLRGDSKYTLQRMLRFAHGGIVAFSTKPLRVGIALGLVTSALAFTALCYIISQYALGHTVPGWASTLGLLVFLFGVLFVILGVIGEYVGLIYIMLQRRPAYVIDEETAACR